MALLLILFILAFVLPLTGNLIYSLLINTVIGFILIFVVNAVFGLGIVSALRRYPVRPALALDSVSLEHASFCRLKQQVSSWVEGHILVWEEIRIAFLLLKDLSPKPEGYLPERD